MMSHPIQQVGGEYAAMRARLGFAVSPKAHVRLDLIRPPVKALPPPVPPVKAKRIRPETEGADALEETLAPSPPGHWKVIAREVCEKHGVSMIDLVSARRDKKVAVARHEAFWRCRTETRLSLPQIGKRFGGRDHTTVLHGVNKHKERMEAARFSPEPVNPGSAKRVACEADSMVRNSRPPFENEAAT
jgi:hypothetical protein